MVESAKEIRRGFWLVVGSFLVLISLLFIFVAALKLDSIQQDKKIRETAARAKAVAARNTAALCEFRVELASRIPRMRAKLARSTEFLKEHPNGIPGIKRSLIEAGIADDQVALDRTTRAVTALGTLICPKPGPQEEQ